MIIICTYDWLSKANHVCTQTVIVPAIAVPNNYAFLPRAWQPVQQVWHKPYHFSLPSYANTCLPVCYKQNSILHGVSRILHEGRHKELIIELITIIVIAPIKYDYVLNDFAIHMCCASVCTRMFCSFATLSSGTYFPLKYEFTAKETTPSIGVAPHQLDVSFPALWA